MKRNRRLCVVLVLSAWTTSGASAEGTAVGYCAGGGATLYERETCSARDSATLIAATRVTKGRRDFCAAFLKAQWSYLPLDRDHSISEEAAQRFLSVPGATSSVAPKLGYFDVNNDNQPEYLAWASAYSGAGQGCDIEVYMEVDSAGSPIAQSPLTALLLPASCGSYQRAFRFRGKTYLEDRRTIKAPKTDVYYPAVLTEVYIIEGRKQRSVCSFALPTLR